MSERFFFLTGFRPAGIMGNMRLPRSDNQRNAGHAGAILCFSVTERTGWLVFIGDDMKSISFIISILLLCLFLAGCSISKTPRQIISGKQYSTQQQPPIPYRDPEPQLDFEPASPFSDSRSKFQGDQQHWQDVINKTIRVTQTPVR